METTRVMALGGYIKGRKTKLIFLLREGLQCELTSSAGEQGGCIEETHRIPGWQCSRTA